MVILVWKRDLEMILDHWKLIHVAKIWIIKMLSAIHTDEFITFRYSLDILKFTAIPLFINEARVLINYCVINSFFTAS